VVQAWQLTSNNVITHLADFTFTSNVFTKAVPPQSITLFVVPTAPAPPQIRVGSLSTSNTFDLWVDAQSNFRYVIQSATNFSSWTSLATNTPTSNSWHVVLPTANRDFTLYRARWLP